MKYHDVEINFTPTADKDLSIKIDGKEFGTTCGIVIKSPLANEDGHTTVEIKFHAKVKGKIRTDRLIKTKLEDK